MKLLGKILMIFNKLILNSTLRTRLQFKGKDIVTSRMEKPDCAGNSVERIGQVEEDPQKKDTRRSTRPHKENVLLRDFDH
ncbi:hypothetical protein SESBI_35626 [Sesbania bispinosa]|nr:hypothetical protein SESBI_35626 [Sesbania bispinosa]